MKIAIGCDHGGFDAKEEVVSKLRKEGIEVEDVGTMSNDSVDYPIYAFKCAKLVQEKKVDKGVLICSSGEGVMICANKVKGIRCGMGYNDEVSKLMVEHNHANMIAFGAKFMSAEEIYKRIIIFLETKPSEEERHVRRVKQIVEQ